MNPSLKYAGTLRFFHSNLTFLLLDLTSGFVPCCKPLVFKFMKVLIADFDNNIPSSMPVFLI